MGKPLFKASDGGYHQIVRVTEDSTQSGLQQGPETFVLVEQKVRPEAFPSGLPMSVWAKIYAAFGITFVGILCLTHSCLIYEKTSRRFILKGFF